MIFLFLRTELNALKTKVDDIEEVDKLKSTDSEENEGGFFQN